MKMPLILAILGAVVGIVVSLALYVFVFGGGSSGAQVAAVPTAVPTVVNIPGKLGPHITLDDRIFNLRSAVPAYLKMQTIIEFETTDPRWARVLRGCVMNLTPLAGPLYASAAPGGAGVGASRTGGTEAGGSACEAEEHKLQAEIAEEIGTGRQLIEDAITTIVSAKTPEELASPEGKEALKGEILHAVQELLEEQTVTRVLFVNFITQ
jgi:flagellar basal body-associated protein FliL